MTRPALIGLTWLWRAPLSSESPVLLRSEDGAWVCLLAWDTAESVWSVVMPGGVPIASYSPAEVEQMCQRDSLEFASLLR